MMHKPIQNADMLPATKPDKMFSDAPPCFEQFVTRGVFVDHPSGRFRQPRIPFRQRGIAETEETQGAGAKILYHHVSLVAQL